MHFVITMVRTGFIWIMRGTSNGL